jgi:hypothetical protein
LPDGALSLGGLCGLLERASVAVSNDTGPLHLALAIGKPCVGIFWHTNLADGMPLRPSLLRAAPSLASWWRGRDRNAASAPAGCARGRRTTSSVDACAREYAWEIGASGYIG